MKRRLLILSFLILGCARQVATPPFVIAQPSCALTSWIMQQKPHSTRTPELPPNLRDTVVVVSGASHKISIPQGFTMRVFASVNQARGLALSPDGVIYATSYNGNIYALPDHNHDGFPDSVITVATGLGDPHGIGFYNGELYVSNNSSLYHLIDANHDRVAESKTLVAALPPSGGHHTRNFVFDQVNQKIYVQVGSNGNMDTTDLAHRADILEFNIDGSGERVYARGLRNAVGMDLDPRTNALWVNVNGMDDLFGTNTPLSQNNPSEGIYIVCDGANYGWPWAYGFQMRNPQQPWVSLDTNIIKTFDGPVAEILAHSAPLGLHFYRGSALPAQYHTAIFQCYHGSWDRTPPAPPRVTVMWADSDGHNPRVTDFVNGFQPDSSGTRWGRPVSVIEGADGALYVSDDQAGVVYRIAWTGQQQNSLQIDNSNLTGQQFAAGTVVPIRWTSTNVDSVTISFSVNGGVTWTVDGGAHQQPYLWLVPTVSTTAARIRLSDAGSQLESISDPFGISTIGVAPHHERAGFSLGLFTPDPADRTATVSFYTARSVRLHAEFCGMLGSIIETAYDEMVDPGDHTLTFDLSKLPAGAYILRVTADDEVTSERIIVRR